MTNRIARYIPLLLIAVLLFIAGCGKQAATPSASSSSPSSSNPSPSTPSSPPSSTPPSSSTGQTPAEEDEIDVLIRSMTLEERIGQLVLAGVDGTTLDKGAQRMLQEHPIGGIILFKDNMSDAQSTAKLLQALAEANEGNPVPLFFSIDHEGGVVNRLPKTFTAIPGNAKVASFDRTALTEEMGRLLAEQIKLLGFNLNFAPVLDLNLGPKSAIGSRSFGDNPQRVAELGAALITGMQGDEVIAAAKHFPGIGDTVVDSHLDLPVIDKSADELARNEWVPFKAAIDADVGMVMVGHVLVPNLDSKLPSSLSGPIISGQLRDELGFDGVVITDDITMGAITKNYGLAEAAVSAVTAGADIVLVAHGYNAEKEVFTALLEATLEGALSEKRIDESVRRILTLKNKYALDAHSVSVPEADAIKRSNEQVDSWLKNLK